MFRHAAETWNELKLSGDGLPGATVDNSSIAYDRRRYLIWGTDTNGQIYVLRLDVRSAGKKPIAAE